jgi:glycine/D-amino acid oxidase-like deaminating enzyme
MDQDENTDEEDSPLTPSPHHPITPSPRIAVIGAGIVGAAVAHRLAGKGVATLLLDRAAPGSGATGASLGGVTAREQTRRDFYDLCVAAMEEYRRLAWKLAPAPWYHADGALAWLRDPSSAAALAERVQRLRSWGYAAEMVPAGDVLRDLQPGLAITDLETPVAWFPDEAWVDPLAMTNRLVEGVRNAGGRVLTGPEREVVAIGMQDIRVTSVTLRGGQTIPVAAVVNAAGTNAANVAALVGQSLNVLSPRSLALYAELPGGQAPLRRQLRIGRVFMRPDGPGRVMLVSQVDVEDAPSGPLPLDDPRVTESLALASEAVPALAAARPARAEVAPWPLLADGLPCVGAVPEIQGYFEAVTDYGITLAPLIARSLADEVSGRPGDPLLAPFRPKR